MHGRIQSTKRLFGWPRDKLLLTLVWYSCMMSAGLIYIAHDRLYRHNTTPIHMVPRHDNIPSTQLSIRRWARRGFTSKTPEPQSVITSSSHVTELLIDRRNVASGGPSVGVDNTTPTLIRELTGYVNVIDNRVLQLNCGQCALVSSSGQLLHRGAGSDIDQSECVIRMNSAPVRTYEEDVGRRTTIRVIGHVNLGKGIHNDTTTQKELFGDPDERPDVVIIPWLYAATINKTTDRAWNTAIELSKLYPDVEFYVLTSEHMNKSEEIFQHEVGMSRQEAHTWLSTGWMSMLFAMEACDVIDVYGLVEENHCAKHPNDTALYHYFEPDFRKECDYYSASEGMLRYGHKFITEKAIFAKWSLQRPISFHYPSWTATESNATELDTPFLRTYREALRNGTLTELQSIPKKTQLKTKKIVRRKKVIKIIRRRKKITLKTNLTSSLKTGDSFIGDGNNQIEQTVLVLNNSRDRGTIAGRDPDSLRRAELMRLARRKIIRSRQNKTN